MRPEDQIQDELDRLEQSIFDAEADYPNGVHDGRKRALRWVLEREDDA